MVKVTAARDRVEPAGSIAAMIDVAADDDVAAAAAAADQGVPAVRMGQAEAVVRRRAPVPHPAAAVMEATPAVRIDKWLWAVRLFRTRSAAAEACNGGKVTVNGLNAKPARSIRPGDIICAHTGVLTRTVRVTLAIERRIGAALVAQHLEDLTPAAEYEAARQRNSAPIGGYRPPGAGRPTKRDRRILQSFFGDESASESGGES